jgi:hypothetical protein
MVNIFQLDDNKLIEKFIQGSNQLLASDRMRLEVNGSVSQLISRNGDPIAIMYLQDKPRTVIIKQNSPFLTALDSSLHAQGFVAIGDASRAGFIEYKYYITPPGYQIFYTDPAILWKKWWPTERFQNKRRFNMDILVSFKDNWYPIQDIVVSAGNFTLKTIVGQLSLKRDGKVLWLAQIVPAEQSTHFTDPSEPADNSTFTALETAPQPKLSTRIGANYSSTKLTIKPPEHPLEVQVREQLAAIEELQQKLNAQIDANSELEQKCFKLEHRAAIAEQRLEIVYKYLATININPQDIYRVK